MVRGWAIVEKCGLRVVLYRGRLVQHRPRVVCMLLGHVFQPASRQCIRIIE